MKNTVKCYALMTILCIVNIAKAQNSRYSDFNHIGWATFNFNIKLNKKIDLLADYQFRRDEFGLKTQQHQWRAGIQKNINKRASILMGYSFIETFPFGDPRFPLSPSRVNYPEHRLYQQLVLKDQIGRVELTHRYRLEQRLVAYQPTEYSHDIKEWRYTNRFRYMLRFQVPFKGETTGEKQWYFAGYDELFVSFGHFVRYNMFDQNRSALLLGYKFNKKYRVEAGPFAQIAQLGALRNVSGYSDNKTIMQYNLGFIINTYINLDWSKKTQEEPKS
ncbi:MAG: hypothetical protein RLZZ318_672 [Bacteroidota bacterium]